MKWLSSLRRDATDSSDGGAQAEEAVAAPPAETIRHSDLAEAVGPFEAPIGSESIPEGEIRSDPQTESRCEGTAASTPSMSAETSDGRILREIVAGEIRTAVGPLGEAQKALQEQFTARIRSDEVQAKALETLHDDLKRYKSNFVRQQMLPLLKEVIFCHDFVSAQCERATGDEAAANSPAVNALTATKQMLLDLLFKYDVEPYQGEGEQFDPKNQQCARTVPTGRAEADKMIAGRLQAGFRSPDGIVRREQVTVFKFTPGAE